MELIAGSHIYQQITSQQRNVEPMLRETRELLTSFYAPYNKELAQILNNNNYLWSTPDVGETDIQTPYDVQNDELIAPSEVQFSNIGQLEPVLNDVEINEFESNSLDQNEWETNELQSNGMDLNIPDEIQFNEYVRNYERSEDVNT